MTKVLLLKIRDFHDHETFFYQQTEPENNFLISLVIENPDSNISHALISSVISDWYELFVRFNGPIGSLGSTEETISILDLFYTKCIQNMPVYSYSLPELFRSFNFESDKIWVCSQDVHDSSAVRVTLISANGLIVSDFQDKR